jgi:hypothetical protein
MDELNFWVTEETEIPSELMQAITQNNLVLFVGAGASMGSPSNLPSFYDLVKQICIKTKHSEFLTSEKRKLKRRASERGLDSILGAIADSMGKTGNTLHDEIYQILSEPRDTNNTHQAIINLAAAVESFRVVTTNQDTLLEKENLYQRIKRPSVFDAPALPEGDNFTGIVNLHGSIRCSNQMIFTDLDFGRAYLTKQYCARFLTELFSSFTVLFIGYSHDDPLMKYHARGLGKCHRFILTDDPNNNKWDILNIIPIPYGKGKHEDIPPILNGLADYIRLSPGERKLRVRKIASAEPLSLSRYDISLIQDCFTSPNGDMLFDFLKNANDYRWCNLLENEIAPSVQKTFQLIFQGDEYSAALKDLTDWFLRVCFVTENKTAHVYGFKRLMRVHGEWSDFFFEQVLQVMINKNTPHGVKQKLELLCISKLARYSLHRYMVLVRFLHELDIYEQRQLIIALLKKITEPIATINHLWFGIACDTDAYEIQPHFLSDDRQATWEFDEWWDINGAQFGYHEELLNIFSYNLEKYYLYREQKDSKISFDSISYSIDSLFDENLSNKHIIIKMIRDILASGNKAIRQSFCEKYQSSSYPLFLRLCIFAIASSPEINDDDKIEWLIRYDLLLPDKIALYANFEIYKVLNISLINASEMTKDSLIEYIQKKRSRANTDGNEDTWAQYELCCWIKNIRNDWVKDFAPLVKKYKQQDYWEEDSKPTTRGAYASFVPEALPAIEARDFIHVLNIEPQRAINDLFSVQTEYEKAWRQSIDRYNTYYQAIRSAVKSDNAVALKLWDINYADTIASEYESSIRLVVIDELRQNYDYYIFIEMLPRLLNFIQHAQFKDHDSNPILRYIYEVISKHKDDFQLETILCTANLCESLWEKCNSDFKGDNDREDLASMSPNYWPCSLVILLMLLLDLHNKASVENNIPEFIKRIFNLIFSTENQAACYSILSIFMDFRFIYCCEASYGIERLMPIINVPIEKHSASWYAWSGFLFRPTFDNRMLNSGLYKAIRTQLAIISSKTFDRSHNYTQFCHMLFSVLSFASLRTKDFKHLFDGIYKNEKCSIGLLQQVGYYYQNSESEEFDAIWDRWLEEFVCNRLSNRPTTIRSEEFKEIFEISFNCIDRFDVISNAIIRSKHKLSFEAHEYFLSISDSQITKLLSNHPQALADLLCYVLENHEGKVNYSFLRTTTNILKKIGDEYKVQIESAGRRSGIALQ